MRRILPLLLSLLLSVPLLARAQEEDASGDEDEEAKPPPKKKSKGDAAAEKTETRFEDLEITKKRKKKIVEKPEAEATEQPVAEEKPDPSSVKSQILTALEEDKPLSGFARHRYGYIIGAGFLVTGLALAYSSQGEAKRAETIGTAREASQALENARASAASANVFYGVAIAALAVTILFEIIPEPLARSASLTFHF